MMWNLDVVATLESNARSYSRAFPAVFKTSVNARIKTGDGRESQVVKLLPQLTVESDTLAEGLTVLQGCRQS